MGGRNGGRVAEISRRGLFRRPPTEAAGRSAATSALADRAPGVPLLDTEGIERKALLEAEHWWYRGRRRIVLDRIAAIPLTARPRVLDAGCGSGALLADLQRLGDVTGVDANPGAVEYARHRGIGDVHLGAVERLPFGENEFDLVTCLDVLEHVRDDGAALAELRRVTRPGGFLVATAPAYPALWAPHDVAAGHVRRYRRGGLRAAGAREGWRPVMETGFNAILLPLAACARLAARLRGAQPRSDLLATPRRLGALLEWPLQVEAAVIRRDRRLPGGLSVLTVFQNPAPAR